MTLQQKVYNGNSEEQGSGQMLLQQNKTYPYFKVNNKASKTELLYIKNTAFKIESCYV